jgi:hypothetical protein
MVKKKGLNVFQIVGLSLIALIAVSALSIGISGNMTGNAVWGWSHCSSTNSCPSGEGDCDRDRDCLTNYCAQNVGSNYGKSRSMDVCECATGTTWDGQSCVSGSSTPAASSSIGGLINSYLIEEGETISVGSKSVEISYINSQEVILMFDSESVPSLVERESHILNDGSIVSILDIDQPAEIGENAVVALFHAPSGARSFYGTIDEGETMVILNKDVRIEYLDVFETTFVIEGERVPRWAKLGIGETYKLEDGSILVVRGITKSPEVGVVGSVDITYVVP